MNISQTLSRLHQRERVLPTGNATAGLCLALKALGLKGKRVAIPNSVCPNVPMAVLFSGNTPVFVDIERRDLGLSLSRLKQEKVDAVIAVHAYGSVGEVEPLAGYCAKSNIPLIEDLAVAQGASSGGHPVGSFGDVSLVSFGAGKIIDCGFGGAVMTDDAGLFRSIEKLEAALPGFSAKLHEGAGRVMAGLRDHYNRWVDRDLNGFWKPFRSLALAAQPSFMHRFSKDWEPEIVKRLGALDGALQRRARRVEKLKRALAQADPEALEFLEHPEGSVYWRLSVLVRKDRNSLLKRLLGKKLRVSSWQAPADLLFGPRKARTADFPVSDRLGAEILNIWVNDEIDEKYLDTMCGEILEFCARHEQKEEVKS